MAIDATEYKLTFEPDLPCIVCKTATNQGRAISVVFTDLGYTGISDFKDDYLLSPLCQECTDKLRIKDIPG